MARASSTDPLDKFRYLVEFTSTGDSQPTVITLGFTSVQMPKKTVTKIEYREGDFADIKALSAGLAAMEDIQLSKGVISGSQLSVFYQWMSATAGATKGAYGTERNGTATGSQANGQEFEGPNSADKYRKDVTIKVLTRTGAVGKKFVLYNAFPVNFESGSDLVATEDTEKLIESLTLAYEDFKEVP